jgi:hypothetical protein
MAFFYAIRPLETSARIYLIIGMLERFMCKIINMH